ncbi:MAG: TetR/AcrR family transcriptional regulator [Nevskiaceae bacterium]|nr:MAG: TetR/AcrR family transcriptional regulator [Nevskiaceae bacterium]TBR74286.1 MAG: TetR/AcrR family transcriptional regulator [Nevskiaceae bacterium]
MPSLPVPADHERPRRRGRPRKTALERAESPRRAEVLRVAARLFCERGFHATTTRAIAAAADMQSGSPFYYFKSKRALLHAVMQNGMREAQVRQDAALAALPVGSPPRDMLRALIRSHLDVLLGPDADFIPVMLLEWRSLTPVQQKAITTQKDAYEAAWMPVLVALRRDGALAAQPEVARLFMFGALNWAVKWFDARGTLSLDALAAQALALFIGDA